MMDMPEKLLLIAVLLAFAYPLVKRLLLEWAQPARMELLEIMKRIMNSPEYRPEEKCYVRAIADKALDWKETALIAALFPYFLAMELLENGQNREIYARLSKNEDFQRLVDLEIRSSIAANPIAATVILIEISAVLLVGLVFGAGMDFARKLFMDFLTRNLPNTPAPATNRGR